MTVDELTAQLDSGKPSEASILKSAREQARNEGEMGRLRAQMGSLREMLRESHRVLKHLMGQEKALRGELATARRNGERAEQLNVEYLKNIVVAFLIKVYGDAEDDEHVKLARVLQTVLHFAPGEAAAVDAKIDYYMASWWHRAGNVLKKDGGGSYGSTVWGAVFGGGGGATSATGAVAALAAPSAR